MILHHNLGVVICGTSSGAVTVWSMDDNHLVTALEGHEGILDTAKLPANELPDRVTCLSGDGKASQFASGSYDKTVRVWGVAGDGTWSCNNSFSDHNGSVTCVEIRGNYVISGSFDNSLKVFGIFTFIINP